MADTYEKDLAQKTSLTTSDYIRVVGSDNVSYKQLVSDVAKKILENYTGTQFNGSNQTVQNAITNAKAMGALTQLGTSDANTLMATGSYGVQNATSANHVPSGETRGILYVYHGMGFWTSTNDLYQEFISYDSAKHYYRYYRTSNSSWADWKDTNALEFGSLSSSHTLDSSLTYLIKSGRTVFLTLSLTTTSAVGNYGVVATIPSGFSPYAQMWGSTVNCDFDITAGGNIRTINSLASGAHINISATYLTV